MNCINLKKPIFSLTMLRGNGDPHSHLEMRHFKMRHFETSHLKKPRFPVLNFKSLIQLLKSKTWETRLFKMLRLGMPRLQTRH